MANVGPKVFLFILLLIICLGAILAETDSEDYDTEEDETEALRKDRQLLSRDSNKRNGNEGTYDEDDDDGGENELAVDVHVRSARKENQFVGTNLLGLNSGRSRCFTQEDVALLVARKEYEKLLPRIRGPLKLETDRSVQIQLVYFHGAMDIVAQRCGANTRHVSSVALADLIGGYLNYVFVPLVRLSFYAGSVDYTNAVSVLRMHDRLKLALNTMGNGWRTPRSEWFRVQSVHVEALNISALVGSHSSAAERTAIDPDRLPCGGLILLSASDQMESNRMLVALPRLEMSPVSDESHQPRIELLWLPFKGRRQRTFEATSRAGAFVLMRYYVDVMKCYAFRGLTPRKFERRFADWLVDRVLPLTQDTYTTTPFYPAFGGILRVAQTLHIGPASRESGGGGDGDGRLHRRSDTSNNDENNGGNMSEDFASIEREVQDILRTRNAGPASTKSLDKALHKLNAAQRRERINTRALLVICALGLTLLFLMSCLIWITLRRRRKMHKRQARAVLEDGDGDDSVVEQQQHKTKKRFWHRLRRKHQPTALSTTEDDERIDCTPDSPSVMRSRSHQNSGHHADHHHQQQHDHHHANKSSKISAQQRQSVPRISAGGGKTARFAIKVTNSAQSCKTGSNGRRLMQLNHSHSRHFWNNGSGNGILKMTAAGTEPANCRTSATSLQSSSASSCIDGGAKAKQTIVRADIHRDGSIDGLPPQSLPPFSQLQQPTRIPKLLKSPRSPSTTTPRSAASSPRPSIARTSPRLQRPFTPVKWRTKTSSEPTSHQAPNEQ